jgi:4-hydroxy-3-methylbut-2-enyl diphosphate reductase
MTRPLRVILAEPRGFCAGVVRAVEIVERALRLHGAPVYVRHEIVHNRRVVDDLRAKGAVFINEVDEAPPGAMTIFSAHGVSEQVERDAQARGLDVIDAICPLVQRVHTQAQRYGGLGYNVVLVGSSAMPVIRRWRACAAVCPVVCRWWAQSRTWPGSSLMMRPASPMSRKRP